MNRQTSPQGLSYLHSGTGRPVIFIHGWAMSASIWERQLNYFSEKGFKAIAIDLRGHGKSICEKPYTISEMASDLESFISDTGCERPFLVGWSMGAMVILAYLFKYSSSATAFCLVGSTSKFTASDDYPHGLLVDEVRGMKVKLKRDFARCLKEFRNSISGDLNDEDKKFVMNMAAPQAEAAKEGLNQLMKNDLRNSLEKIKLPALLFHGSNDRVCPPGAATYMNDWLAHSRLHFIKGAGHIPFLSHEEEFNKNLESFFRESQ